VGGEGCVDHLKHPPESGVNFETETELHGQLSHEGCLAEKVGSKRGVVPPKTAPLGTY